MTWANVPWDLVATVAFRLVVLAVIVFVVIRLSTRRPRPTSAVWPAPTGPLEANGHRATCDVNLYPDQADVPCNLGCRR